MRTSSRRRLDVVLLGAGAAAPGVTALIGGLVGDAERVAGMWVGAALATDGSAAVTEVIDYDFGFQERRGIFRTIPGVSSEAHHAEAAAARGVLREYTAWAVALGELDRWERAVSASAVADQADLGYVHLAPALMTSTSQASTAPSSSGSGGGGSVGGGGGGGGGGSW